MAVRQKQNKKERKSLKSLLKEMHILLREFPDIIYDEKFEGTRYVPSNLRDAYNRYNELLDEVENYVERQGSGASAFKPR